MPRLLLAALIVTAGLGGAAHAQSQSRPMPSYQDDENWSSPTPSDDNANSRDARRDDGYAPGYGDPQTPRRRAHSNEDDDGYAGEPPAGEDAAHRADRLRTADLNHRAYARPQSADGRPRSRADAGQADYAQQSAQYRAELDDHAHAVQDYRAEQARYAERIARWRARANACEAGDLDACDGPQ